MGGGLIQIVSYGGQDLFLTGNPEITFFKEVYRRHTNFSSESIELQFEDDVGFGKESTLIFPKVGDLLHKLYAKITIPEMTLKRGDATDDFLEDLNEAYFDFQVTVKNFMQFNIEAYRRVKEIRAAINTTTSAPIIKKIEDIFGNPPGSQTGSGLTPDILINFERLVDRNAQELLTSGASPRIENIALYVIAANFDGTESEDEIFAAIEVAFINSQNVHQFFSDKLTDLRQSHEEESNDQLKFAWVERLGHAIIDRIEIDIGGYNIDRQYGDWLNIWYELTGNKDLEDIYDKMIGNVEELTAFNRKPTPEYTLYVPLQFWFCRYNGLALPLVALQYHDVSLRIKFRQLHECAYMERDKMILVENFLDEIFLDEVVQELDKEIRVSILADYIYLDSDERKRFAQSSHEYLIEQVQRDIFTNISSRSPNFELNFEHPSKEIIWVAQQVKFTRNDDGYTQTRFDNYTLTEENEKSIIESTKIEYHSYVRSEDLNSTYYNSLQPYIYHRNTPSDGIFVYSFALNPEEYQPSGTSNFSRLSRAILNVTFDSTLFPEEEDPAEIEFRVYTQNYNILRIVGGMAGCAYICGN